MKNYLKELPFDKLVWVWNECATENGEAFISDNMDDLAENSFIDGVELARKVFFGKLRSWNDKVYFNGNDNVESCWDLESSPIDISYLAEWLKDNNLEVYQDFVGEYGEPQPFDEWLDDNLTKAELLALWDEYSFDEGDENFDLEELAEMLEEDEHPHYKAWLEEQEDDEISEDV